MNTPPVLVAELRELRLIDAARRDLASTLQWSYDRFGAAAADRYASLIETVFPGHAAKPVSCWLTKALKRCGL